MCRSGTKHRQFGGLSLCEDVPSRGNWAPIVPEPTVSIHHPHRPDPMHCDRATQRDTRLLPRKVVLNYVEWWSGGVRNKQGRRAETTETWAIPRVGDVAGPVYRRPMRWFTCLILAGSVIVAACSDDSSDVASPSTTLPSASAGGDDGSVSTTSTTDAPTTTTTESTAPATEDPSTTGGPAIGGTEITTLDDLRPAAAAWVETWRLVNDRVPEIDLRTVATEAGSDVLETRLQLGTNPPSRRFNLYPTTTTNADGTVTIDDCTMVSPPIEEPNVGVHYRATVEQIDNTWIVTDTTLVNRDGCVPTALVNEVIADYEAYWDAQVLIWAPADPSHPALAETTAGTHRDGLIELLSTFEGFELRGRPQTNPEITGYTAVDRIEIADCQVTDPESGLFNVESGQRSDETPAPRADQRDGREIAMKRIEGVWKVVDRRGSTDIDCDFAPTELGLALT